MNPLAIRVEKVGKTYRIGAHQQQYRTLRDTLVDAAKSPLRRAAAVLQGRATQASEVEFFALRDEIVAFAEVDKFIDTPVNRSSSGIFMRLAFAVAMSQVDDIPLEQRTDRGGNGLAKLVSLHIESMDRGRAIRPGSRLRVRIGYRNETVLRNAHSCVSVLDYTLGSRIFMLGYNLTRDLPASLPATGVVTCTTGPINLSPGRCYVNASLIVNQATVDYVQHAANFEVETDDVYGTGKIPSREDALNIIQQQWSVERA